MHTEILSIEDGEKRKLEFFKWLVDFLVTHSPPKKYGTVEQGGRSTELGTANKQSGPFYRENNLINTTSWQWFSWGEHGVKIQ